MSTIQLNDSLYSDISTKCPVILRDDTTAGLSIISIILMSNFLVGLPANAWVVWLICRGTRELLASEIYLLNLAVCEILYCLGLPVQLYCMHSFERVSDGIYDLLLLHWLLVWVCRPIFQTCICVERYIAVVHPLIYIRFKPLKYKVAPCALAWCVFFLTAWLMTALTGINIVLIWFLPTLCMLLYCYFSVLCSLKQPGPGEGENRRGDKMKRKAFNIILVHLVCFLVNYIPPLVAGYLSRKIQISNIVLDLILSLGTLCGLVQPLLYLHRVGMPSCIMRQLKVK